MPLLAMFQKTNILGSQTYVKRWDNLYITNILRLSKFRRQHRLLFNAVTRIQYFQIELCGGTANKNKVLFLFNTAHEVKTVR